MSDFTKEQLAELDKALEEPLLDIDDIIELPEPDEIVYNYRKHHKKDNIKVIIGSTIIFLVLVISYVTYALNR